MKTDKGSFWIASRLGLSHRQDQWILMDDLNMWQHISAKSVLWLLTYKQEQWCVFVCQEDEVKNYQNFLQRPKQETKSVFTHKTLKPIISPQWKSLSTPYPKKLKQVSWPPSAYSFLTVHCSSGICPSMPYG